MTAAKIMGVIARLPACDGQAADPVSACTQVKLEGAPRLLKIPKSECPDVWLRLPRHKWPKSWEKLKTLWYFLNETCTVTHYPGYYGKGKEKVPNWECMFVHRKQGLFLSENVDDIKMTGKKAQFGSHVEKVDEKCGYWRTHIISWPRLLGIHSTWMQPEWSNHWTIQNHVWITHFCWSNRKLPGWQRLRAQTVARSFDMEGHAQKCVERYRELVNMKVEHFHKVSHPCLDDHQFKQEEFESNLLENCQQFARKLSWNACTRHELDDLTSCGQWTSLQDQSQNGPTHVTNDRQGWFPFFITRMTIVNIVMSETRHITACTSVESDPTDHLEESVRGDVNWRRNYSSGAELADKVKDVRDDQATRGQVFKLSETEARRKIAQHVTASLGALGKNKLQGVVAAKVLFNGPQAFPSTRGHQ